VRDVRPGHVGRLAVDLERRSLGIHFFDERLRKARGVRESGALCVQQAAAATHVNEARAVLPERGEDLDRCTRRSRVHGLVRAADREHDRVAGGGLLAERRR
jgi:hypothetical protein